MAGIYHQFVWIHLKKTLVKEHYYIFELSWMTMDFDTLSNIITINDLLDKEYDGIALTTDERFAMIRFHNFRAHYLSESMNEREYEKRYLEMQAKANLAPYEIFLKSEYNTKTTAT